MRKASKAKIKPGQYADLAVLSADYFKVPEDEIQNLVSVLTIVGGRIVYGDDEFSALSPPLPPAMPDWSPAITSVAISNLWQVQQRHIRLHKRLVVAESVVPYMVMLMNARIRML